MISAEFTAAAAFTVIIVGVLGLFAWIVGAYMGKFDL